MTRNIRKIVSVVCAVALLLSLCAVSFIGSSSAIHLDAVESDNSAQKFETFKTYDFNNASGFGYRRYIGTFEFKDGGVTLYNNTSGGGVFFAADPAHTDVVNHTEAGDQQKAAASSTLLKLEAGATYKISLTYKCLAGSTKGKVGLYVAPDATGVADSAAPNINKGYISVTNSENEFPESYDSALTEDTEFRTVVHTFVVGAKDINFGLSPAMGGGKFLVDKVVLEKAYTVIDKTEVYNWTTEGDTPLYYDPNDNGYASDSDKTNDDITKGSFVDAEGLHFSFEWRKSSLTYAKSHFKKVLVKTGHEGWEGENRVNRNTVGALTFKATNYYIITMKYKPELIAAGDKAFIGIGYGKPTKEVGTFKYATHKAVLDDWQYLTTVVSGADIAGDRLQLTAASTKGKRCSFLVESVTVRTVNQSILLFETEYGELESEIGLVAPGATPSSMPVPTNLPEGKGFAGWYAGDVLVDSTWTAPVGATVLTAKFVSTISKVTFDNQGEQTTTSMAIGLELPAPARPNVNLFFEGWFLEPTFETKVTAVPDYDVTLYAKYNGTFLGFNNISHVKDESSGSPEIVVDPADDNNSVVKFEAKKNKRRNFMLPSYDIAGSGAFELKPNTTYTVSYKVKMISDDITNADVCFYQGDHASGTNTTRTAINASKVNITSTDWTTNSFSFTTGETLYLEYVNWSYQNHIFFTIYNKTEDIGVYVDDFCIAEALTEAPAGTVGVSFETNSDKLPTIYGYPGEAMPELLEPTLAAHEFVGWYTDKNLLAPFTATNFGDKDITVYAKWKASPFVVDFSDYEPGIEGKKSARANFEKDANGNDYLDWWAQHATTNTNQATTPYRLFLNKAGTHYTVETGVQYTITFKYKLLDGNVTFKAVTNNKLDGWRGHKVHDEKNTVNKVTEEWTETSLTFTAAPESGKYLSLGIAGLGHVLIDDVVILAIGGRANLYGSTAIFFNTNGGNNVDAISGDPGEAITYMPTATKPGFAFNGWFVDQECTTPFTDKVWGEEDITLYAGWILGKFNESYEEFPTSVLSTGVSGGYKIYNSIKIADFDKANVQNGETSLFRDGTQNGNKAFTICRDSDIALTVGKQYTMTFYVKPSNVTDAAGTISLIGLKTNTGIATPQSTNVITTVGDLKAGQWQKVTYTFTADSKYIGLSTTAGNDMYLDNFTVSLKGYTGTTTGDFSVNPILIVLMIVLAAGSLVVTGKKVFEK